MLNLKYDNFIVVLRRMSFFFGDGLKYLGVLQHNASKFSNGLAKLGKSADVAKC